MVRSRSVLFAVLTLALAACTSATTSSQSQALPESTPTPSATGSAKPTPDRNAFTLTTKLVQLAPWSGKDLDGNDVSTETLTGKVTVVNFWASWCGPCREEWPILQAASEKYANVRFVGINTQDTLEHAKTWVVEHPTNYVHFFDDQSFIKASLTTVPNMGLPITVVLNNKGQVFAWYSGPITEGGLAKILN